MKYSILAAPFPYSEKSTTKVRPVLCLTNPIGPHDEVLVAYITTTRPEPILPTDIELTLEHSSSTHLLHHSYARCHKIVTIAKKALIGSYGQLPTSLHTEVDHAMNHLFE